MATSGIIRAQNRLIRGYRRAGVTEPLRACTPEELGLRRSWVFDRLIDRGVFVPIAEGRCFLDVDATDRFLARRRGRILIVIGIVVFIFILARFID